MNGCRQNENITIIHMTLAHLLMSCETKSCMFVFNKSKMFSVLPEYFIHNITFFIFLYSESGDKYEQIKHCLQEANKQTKTTYQSQIVLKHI